MSAAMLNLMLDGLLLAVFAAGGWFWHRQNLRQHKLERLLADASRQLDQATQQLAEASRLLVEARKEPVGTLHETPNTPDHAGDTARILSLSRQGMSPENIALKLGLPLAQVQLIMKVHGTLAQASGTVKKQVRPRPRAMNPDPDRRQTGT